MAAAEACRSGNAAPHPLSTSVLLQNGLAEATSKSRKQIKERKNRTKKIRGVKKNAGVHTMQHFWLALVKV